MLQEHHQDVDFAPRALPVFDGERVKRQYRDIQTCARLDGLADGGDPGAVDLDAGKALAFGPTPITVHDDGDVARKPLEVDLVEELSLDGPCTGRIEDILAAHS